MNDTTSYHPDAIDAREKLSSLSALVYEAVESGIETALEIDDNYFHAGKPSDPWHFSHTVRRKAVEILQSNNSDTGFEVAKNPMSGVEIVCAGFSLKIWKKHIDGYLQPPGESPRRQEFSQGVVHQTRILEFSHLMAPDKNLVYVWERVPDGGLELWLVSPCGFDGVWRPAHSEWVIPIPHPAASMRPEFDFAEAEEDLPIAPDETGEGGDGDAS